MSYAIEPFRSRPQARLLGEPSSKPINESAAAVPERQKNQLKFSYALYVNLYSGKF